MPADFALTEESLGEGRHVVAVRGEIDLFTAPELKKTLADAIENGATKVVVDLSETTFLDSSGLGALVWAQHRLQAAGGDLVAIDPNAAVTPTLEVTGVGRLLLRAA